MSKLILNYIECGDFYFSIEGNDIYGGCVQASVPVDSHYFLDDYHKLYDDTIHTKSELLDELRRQINFICSVNKIPPFDLSENDFHSWTKDKVRMHG